MHENILVCGNGPSCKEIDFTRVPQNAKVMRVTQFYFEELYYAGKHVDYYVDYANKIDESYFTARTLHSKKEYEFDLENMWYTVLREKNPHFPTVRCCTEFIQKSPLIAEFRCFYEYYYGKYLPTGMQAFALAVCLGFKNVYVTGFDFFADKDNMHAYPDGKAAVDTIVNRKRESAYDTGITSNTKDGIFEYIHKTHPTSMQIDFICLLKKLYPETKIMSVNDSGVINEHIPLAPKLMDSPWYSPEPKPTDRVTDLFPLPDEMPAKRK